MSSQKLLKYKFIKKFQTFWEAMKFTHTLPHKYAPVTTSLVNTPVYYI